MKKVTTNYTTVIEKEARTGTNEVCYTAFVPSLGIATEADSVEDAKKAIKAMIKFHLKSLVQEGEEIPVETEKSIVTSFKTELPEGAILSGNA